MQAFFNNPIFYKYRLLEKHRYSRSKSNFWVRQMGLVWCVLIPLALVLLTQLPDLIESIKPPFDLFTVHCQIVKTAKVCTGTLGISYFFVLMASIGMSLQNGASQVTAEREKKTYDSLHSTMMSANEILNGHLVVSIFSVLRELCLVTPVALILGVVSGLATEAVIALTILFSTVLFYGMLGLWISYICKNTKQAQRMSTSLGVGLLIFTPIISAGTGIKELLYFHPVYASSEILTMNIVPISNVVFLQLGAAVLLWLDALRRERSAVRI